MPNSIYGDDDEGLDNGQTGMPGMLALISSNNTTTKEAQEYARRILSERSSSPGEGELSYLGQLKRQAQENKAILRKARETLAAKKYPTGLAWLRAAAALGAPTKTGAFGESAGNLAASLVPFAEGREEFNQNRDKQLTDFDLAISQADNPTLQAQLQLLKERLANQGRLTNEALKIMGRSIRAPGIGMRGASPYGKIAADEGFTPDTPEYNRRVQELADYDIRVKQAQAGLDSTEDSAARTQLGVEYGIPVPPDPYAGYSTKRRAAAQAIDQRDADKQLATLDGAAPQAQKNISLAKRFVWLNERVPTGKVQGWLPAFNRYSQEMDAITSEISRHMRSPGEGSTSDFDARMFLQATFGRSKLPSANKAIAAAFQVQQQNVLELQDFLHNYLAVNGHLRGARALWNKYLNDNPIFDPDPELAGSYKLNPHRISYQDYFRHLMEQAASQQEEVPVQAKAKGGVVDSVVNPMTQGVTLGHADELAGMVAGDEAKDKIRQSLLQGAEESPVTSQVSTVAGTSLLLKGIQVARQMGLTDAAIRLIPKSELFRLALTGAMGGMMMGLGAGEGENKPESALTSGAVGAATGPLAGLATKYGIIGAHNFVQRLPWANDRVTRGDQRIMQALERDKGISPELRMSEAARAKVPSTMGTSGGEHLQALSKAAIREGGDEADILATEAAKRMAGSRGRVEERINQSLKPDAYFDEMDKLTNALYENSKPLYERAYEESPTIKSKALWKILNTYSGKRAQKEAMKFFRDQPGQKIGKDDALGMVRNPSLEYYDKVKQGFDQLIRKEEKNGPTPRGKVMRDLRRKLVDELDSQSDLYKQARSQYAGDLEVRDALRAGREDFSRLTPEEIKRKVSNMSFAERDAFRSGVSQNLFEAISKPAGDYNAAYKIIASPAMSNKLEAVFEKPSEFKLFKTALERELEEFAKSKELASTAGGARLARASHDPSLIGKLGSQLEAMPYRHSLVGNVWNFLRMRPDMTEQTAEEVAKRLRETDPKKVAKYLQRLERRRVAQKLVKSRAGKAGLAAAFLTGTLTAPNPEGSHLNDEENTGEE